MLWNGGGQSDQGTVEPITPAHKCHWLCVHHIVLGLYRLNHRVNYIVTFVDFAG